MIYLCYKTSGVPFLPCISPTSSGTLRAMIIFDLSHAACWTRSVGFSLPLSGVHATLE